MKRIVCAWEGPSVKGLAVSVLHFSLDVVSPAAAALAAFTAAQPVVPGGVSIVVPTTGDVIDAATGDLTGVWSAPGDGGTVAGTTTAFAAAGVGACVTWETEGIVNSRRVRGRTFWVPMPAGYYEADGTIMQTALDELNEFGASLVASGLTVWHRPTTSGGSDGSSHDATSYRVRDRVAFLSSRRD